MSVSINLRTDILTMYEYEEESLPLTFNKLIKNIEVQKDFIPVAHPYVPRLCKHRAYMLIWYDNDEAFPEISEEIRKYKNESQSVCLTDDSKIETGIVMVWPYENEVILGAVKLPSCFNKLTSVKQRKQIRKLWDDVLEMFGDKRIICPTGTFLECIHLLMNQTRIVHEPYHKKIMKQRGFVKNGDYWIRN
jgi:hypothetical protein